MRTRTIAAATVAGLTLGMLGTWVASELPDSEAPPPAAPSTTTTTTRAPKDGSLIPPMRCDIDHGCPPDGREQTDTQPEEYDGCNEDEACWDCPTMGNRTCGAEAPAWMRDGDPTTGPDGPLG